MPPETLKLLTDMREAASDIAAFATGKTIDQFQADKQLRMAVEISCNRFSGGPEGRAFRRCCAKNPPLRGGAKPSAEVGAFVRNKCPTFV